MSLKDSFRRAAEVFVDMPDEDTPAHHADATVTHAPAADPSADPMADIDRRLSDMNRRLSGGADGDLGHTAGGATDGGVAGAAHVPGKALSAPSLTGASAAGSDLTASGLLDAAAIYERAGVAATPFSSEEALEMIHALPSDLPLAVKQQTMRISIASLGRTIGASTGTICTDARSKRDALTAHANAVAQQTSDFAEAAEFEIATLEEQIAAKRAAMESARQEEKRVREQCTTEAERLGELLSFFGDGTAPGTSAA